MAIHLALLVIGLGFVTAAFLYSVDHVVRGKPGNIVIQSRNPLYWLPSLLYCMFAGPYVVIERGLQLWRKGSIPTAILGFCVVVSTMWSFCSGVFVAQFLMMIGIITT